MGLRGCVLVCSGVQRACRVTQHACTDGAQVTSKLNSVMVLLYVAMLLVCCLRWYRTRANENVLPMVLYLMSKFQNCEDIRQHTAGEQLYVV